MIVTFFVSESAGEQRDGGSQLSLGTWPLDARGPASVRIKRREGIPCLTIFYKLVDIYPCRMACDEGWQHGTADAVHDVEHVYQVSEVDQLQGMHEKSPLPKFWEVTNYGAQRL